MTVPPPPDLLDWLRALGRDAAVLRQEVATRADWFVSAAADAGLPPAGLPIRGTPPLVSRADVFAAADGAREDDARAVGLVLAAVVWGSGLSLRQNRRRLEALGAAWHEPGRPRIAALRSAFGLAADDPVGAYLLLDSGGDAALPAFGPAFSTRILYFAGGGAADHPSPILDAYVAAGVRAGGWERLSAGGWAASTYGRYASMVAERAAAAADELGRPVAVDEVERWLAEVGRATPWEGG